jgi:hypothetical protein
LIEFQLAIPILVLILGLGLAAYLYALRIFEFTKAKVSASDEARHALILLSEEVRAARMIRVGDGSLTNFTELAVDSPQRGSAIQIYPTLLDSVFIRYFWDASDRKLKRTTNGASATLVVANSVSNSLVFTAEDYTGAVLSNNFNNRVIGLTLQFYQIQYPVMPIGPGGVYDFYQIRTKFTRRTLL